MVGMDRGDDDRDGTSPIRRMGEAVGLRESTL